MHRRREGIVRRLRQVDVIVGVDWFLRPHLTARQLDGAVGDDFVDVHVGLRPAASLPDPQRELIVELAGNDFVDSFDDEFCFI